MSTRINETGERIDSTLARTMEGHVAPEELLAVIDQYKADPLAKCAGCCPRSEVETAEPGREMWLHVACAGFPKGSKHMMGEESFRPLVFVKPPRPRLMR